MNRTVRNWSVVAAIVVTVVFAFSLIRSPAREIVMADGTVLRVERVVFGKRDNWVPEVWFQKLKAKIISLLPDRFARKPKSTSTTLVSSPSNWNQVSEVHANADALHVWITRKVLRTGQFVDSRVNFGVLVDEHGCPLLSTQSGGMQNFGTNGNYSVTWLTFEAFPRDQRQFRLRLYDWAYPNSTNLVGEFVIDNPARQSKAKSSWTTQPLPATQRSGDVSFTLTGITIQTNAEFLKARYPNVLGPREIVPAFTVTERGEPSGEWWAGDFDLWDNTGNFASEWPPKSRFLCPDVPAWKLVVKFYGTERSALASNETWVLKGLKVPGPGEFTHLKEVHELMGMKIKAIALAGAGKVVYSNNWSTREISVVETAAPASGERITNGPPNSISRGAGTGGYVMETHKLSTAHLGLSLSALMDDRLLTVTATDDQGRTFQLHEWFNNERREAGWFYRRYEKNPAILLLDLPADAKTVDLTITMHRPRLVEFVVKPQGK
jgi:hypothetical protein